MLRQGSQLFSNARAEDAMNNQLCIARLALCCCAIVPLTICGCFCGFYWSMLSEAMEYNDKVKIPDSDILAYDNCGFYVDVPVPLPDGTVQ